MHTMHAKTIRYKTSMEESYLYIFAFLLMKMENNKILSEDVEEVQDNKKSSKGLKKFVHLPLLVAGLIITGIGALMIKKTYD